MLAGGASRRFGSDKLEARLAGTRLLDLTLRALAGAADIVVVGPPRDLEPLGLEPLGLGPLRQVRFVREEPPGGGPAAALVAGIRHALDLGAEVIVTLPGDAPGAGQAVAPLVAALQAHPGDVAVVGVDPDGRQQTLQLALRPQAAMALITAAGPDAGSGGSARALVATLDPPARPVGLSAEQCRDIDTTGDWANYATGHMRN